MIVQDVEQATMSCVTSWIPERLDHALGDVPPVDDEHIHCRPAVAPQRCD
jgi:hypothetical protein